MSGCVHMSPDDYCASCRPLDTSAVDAEQAKLAAVVGTMGGEVLPYHTWRCEGCGMEWSSKDTWPPESFQTGTSTKYRGWWKRALAFARASWCSPACYDRANP